MLGGPGHGRHVLLGRPGEKRTGDVQRGAKDGGKEKTPLKKTKNRLWSGVKTSAFTVREKIQITPLTIAKVRDAISTEAHQASVQEGGNENTRSKVDILASSSLKVPKVQKRARGTRYMITVTSQDPGWQQIAGKDITSDRGGGGGRGGGVGGAAPSEPKDGMSD